MKCLLLLSPQITGYCDYVLLQQLTGEASRPGENSFKIYREISILTHLYYPLIQIYRTA